MGLALIVLATLLGIAALGSGVQKLRRDPAIMASMKSVGVDASRVPALAILEILGAAGLVVGIWIAPVGIAAAVGLTLYFLGAIIAHLRMKAPAKEGLPAAVLFLLALATALLEITR
jgi:uncharacterized membrane protein YphA (DoxX/SURF4 family)